MFLELLILHLVSLAISAFGGLMMWRHYSLWQRQRVDPQIETGERRFLQSQYRRRMQSSGMVAFLGLLLHGSNEHLIAWQRAPAGFFIYVCVMLVLVLWIVLLALVDFAAGQVVHRHALSRLKEQQQELEQSILEIRRKGQS